MGVVRDPIDEYVSHRAKMRRTMLRLSQGEVAKALRVTAQQIQKYERGFDRIPASKLYRLSRVLDVPVGWFFEGMPGHKDVPEPAPVNEVMSAGNMGILFAIHRLAPEHRKVVQTLIDTLAPPA